MSNKGTNNSLAEYAANITSYGGEDGIIERIFEIIGTENKWCVELGALDGKYDSNSWTLINNDGWSSVLIEENHAYARKISSMYAKNDKVHLIKRFVSFEGKSSLDNLLSTTPIPLDFDLLILDIDGNDYHVWDSLNKFKPRVVSIEFNFTIPNEVDFVQQRDMSVQQGSSLRAMTRLANSKGYELVATTLSNAFFVKKRLYEKFDISDNSTDSLYKENKYQTKMFQLYDGTIMISGYKRLFWHKLDFAEEDIQILPKRKRVYPAHISKYSIIRSLKNRVRTLSAYPKVLSLKRKAMDFLKRRA